MIEILDIAPRELKGTSDRGNYHFFVQKARLTSLDRNGIEETRVFEVQSRPGEVYEPATDYIVDPSSLYIGSVNVGGRHRDRLMVAGSPKLIRASALTQAPKQPLKAAA